MHLCLKGLHTQVDRRTEFERRILLLVVEQDAQR